MIHCRDILYQIPDYFGHWLVPSPHKLATIHHEVIEKWLIAIGLFHKLNSDGDIVGRLENCCVYV